MRKKLDYYNYPECPLEDGTTEYTTLKVGSIVRDILTDSNASIVKIEADNEGNVGIWLDNDYLGGGRFPWEISTMLEKERV